MTLKRSEGGSEVEVKRRKRTKVEVVSNLYHSPLLCLGNSDYFQVLVRTHQSTYKLVSLFSKLLLTVSSLSTVQLFQLDQYSLKSSVLALKYTSKSSV